MPVYRGPGGAGDATNDATVTAVQTAATQAAASATSAANSATAAATSASGAATSATNAANSATTASGYSTTAAGHASSASTYATNSALSADDSADYALESQTYASQAFDSATAAALSASDALTSETNAASSAATASDAVDDALSLYGDAAALSDAVTAAQLAETNAETAETNAETAATTATNAANTATTQAGLAAASALAADADATSASIDANEAQAAATAAQAAVNNAEAIYGSLADIQEADANVTANRDAAAASATSASNSADTATTQAGIATTQANAAAASAAAASAVVLSNEPVRPTIRPSLLLDFANAKQLDPRVTFSRPTTASYYDEKTTVVAEQNLLTYSEQFDNAVWLKSQATATANSTTAPDGTTTADTITSTNSSATGLGVYQPATTAIGSTLSLYAKAGTANFIGVANTSGGNSYANFNLGTGAVASSSGCTASIVSVGSGWYRCIVANVTSAGTSSFFIAPKDADPAASPWQVGTCASGNTVFIWGAQLEQRSSVTAYQVTTTAPITNYIPVLLTQQSNEARFDHNPITRESLGLLIEEQRTNLALRSDDLANATWVKANSSITSNAVVAPDGTQTADAVVEDTANNIHRVYQQITIAANTTATLSAYVKRGAGSRNLYVQWNFGDGIFATFNLGTGTVIGTSVTGTGSLVGATITPVGNNWYRITLSGIASTTNANPFAQFYLTNSSSHDASPASYTGDGFSSIYIWGAQLEAGAFATSYIPTVASQVTRSADSASMTGANFSSWYNNAEGTLYAEANSARPSSEANGVVCSLNDNSAANRIQLGLTNYSNLAVRVYVATNSVEQVSGIGVSTITAGQFAKDSFAYKVNDFIASSAGSLSSADTSGSIPTVTQLTIGYNGYATNSIICGNIKKIAYYPIRVTNAQLQGLTTV